MSRFSQLIQVLRKNEGLSQEQLGRKIGVSQKTLLDWERGKTEPNARNLKKLARYLDKTLDEISAYTSDACQQSPSDFLAGITSNPQTNFHQILEWLPLLKPIEIAEIGRQCLQLLYTKFFPSSESEAQLPTLSIAEMVRQAPPPSFTMIEISAERIQAISEGDRPTDCELVQLPLILKKPGGKTWTTHELMGIRDRDFPPSSQQKEKQHNGA